MIYKIGLILVLAINSFFPGYHLAEHYNHKINGTATAQVSTTQQKVATSWETDISAEPTKEANGIFTPSGSASLSMDEETGTILASANKNAQVPIASLTKLMTAYLTLKEQNLNSIVTVPALNIPTGYSVVGLKQGEKLSILSLLKGLLINSGADAAQTLAIDASGSGQGFVVKMNQAASSLGLKNTKYSNPIGIDDPNNYSSATDLASLTRVLLLNKVFRDIVQTKSATIYTTDGTALPLLNTNQLLGNGIIGVKTGNTTDAGGCLIALYQSGNHQILTVLLGSSDRFGQTAQYLSWINSSFSW